jgi:hypothetical protein
MYFAGAGHRYRFLFFFFSWEEKDKVRKKIFLQFFDTIDKRHRPRDFFNTADGYLAFDLNKAPQK